MIWRDTFPWLSHRTIEEVEETLALREMRAVRNSRQWGTSGHRERLQALEQRACEPDQDPPPAVA